MLDYYRPKGPLTIYPEHDRIWIALLIWMFALPCLCTAQSLVATDSIRVLHLSGIGTKAAYSRDGQYIVTGGEGDTVRVWDVSTGQRLELFKLSGQRPYNLEFFPDGDHLLVVRNAGGGDSAVKWNWRQQKAVWSIPARYATLGSDGTTVISATADGVYVQRNATTGEVTRTIGSFLMNPRGFHVNHRGDRMICYAQVKQSALVDLDNGSIVPSYNYTEEVLAGRFSPNDSVLALGSPNPALLDAQTAKLLDTLPQIYRTFDLAFSPDGSYLATVSIDFSVRLWDAVTGDSVALLGYHKRTAYSVEFSPDGKYLLTCSVDSTARIWPVPQRLSSVRREAVAGRNAALHVYPDPAASQATLEYTVFHPGAVHLTLVDPTGAEVFHRDEPMREPGTYRLPLDLRGLASGMYVAVLSNGAERVARPIRVVR
jgi:WD40 repeat protein